jgi:hypothetical protein
MLSRHILLAFNQRFAAVGHTCRIIVRYNFRRLKQERYDRSDK